MDIQIIGPSSAIPQPMPRRRDIQLPKGSFSFSQFRLEKQCGACYEQRYVERAPMVLKPPLVIGSAIHEGLAHGRRALRANQRVPVGELMEAVAEAFDHSLEGRTRQGEMPAQPPELKLGKSDKSWGDVKDQAIATARFTVQRVLEAEALHQVTAIEAEITMHGVFPFPFSAYADRMLDDESWDSFGHIGDDKSAGKDEPPDVWTAWQVTTYSLPFWLAGELVDVGVNQHIKTKVPNVHLWNEPGYSFRPTADQHRAVYDMIVRSAERVSAGRFEPGPHPYGCDYEHPRYPRFGIVVPEGAVA